MWILLIDDAVNGQDIGGLNSLLFTGGSGSACREVGRMGTNRRKIGRFHLDRVARPGTMAARGLISGKCWMMRECNGWTSSWCWCALWPLLGDRATVGCLEYVHECCARSGA